MESIKSYLEHKQVPRELKRRVRKACSHYYKQKGVAQEDWSLLPPRLRFEITRFEQKFFIDLFPTIALARGGGKEDLLERLVHVLRPFSTIPRQVYFLLLSYSTAGVLPTVQLLYGRCTVV